MLRCSPDSVKVGHVGIDKYESSIRQIPPASTGLVELLQTRRATLADRTKIPTSNTALSRKA
jgi:hypothetical protein